MLFSAGSELHLNSDMPRSAKSILDTFCDVGLLGVPPAKMGVPVHPPECVSPLLSKGTFHFENNLTSRHIPKSLNPNMHSKPLNLKSPYKLCERVERFLGSIHTQRAQMPPMDIPYRFNLNDTRGPSVS